MAHASGLMVGRPAHARAQAAQVSQLFFTSSSADMQKPEDLATLLRATYCLLPASYHPAN